MNKKISKKLSLGQQSIRVLADKDLGTLAGGRIPVISIDEATCVGWRCWSNVRCR